MTDARRERAKWRSRRGLRELDVLLGAFIDRQYTSLSDAERDAFDRLLETPDIELFALLSGRTDASDPNVAVLVRAIRGNRT